MKRERGKEVYIMYIDVVYRCVYIIILQKLPLENSVMVCKCMCFVSTIIFTCVHSYMSVCRGGWAGEGWGRVGKGLKCPCVEEDGLGKGGEWG